MKFSKKNIVIIITGIFIICAIVIASYFVFGKNEKKNKIKKCEIYITGEVPDNHTPTIDELIDNIKYCRNEPYYTSKEIVDRGVNTYVINKLHDMLENDKNFKCRFYAESILLAMDDKDGREERINYILDQLKNNMGYVYDFLKYLDTKKDSKYIDKIIEISKQNSDSRYMATSLLQYFPDYRKGIEYLFSLLNNEDQTIKSVAIGTIEGIPINNPRKKNDLEIMNKIFGFIDDNDPVIRMCVCYALGNYNINSGMKDKLWQVYYHDNDLSVRFAALKNLSKFEDSNTILPIVIDWMENPDYKDYNGSALSLLGEMGPKAEPAVPEIWERYFNISEKEINLDNCVACYDAYNAITEILGKEPELPDDWELWVNGKRIGYSGEKNE